MLHGFQKKTAKTPPGEIEIAQKRMLDFVDPQEEDLLPPDKGTKQQSKKGKGNVNDH